MPVPDKILQLVERFDRNLEAYKHSRYNETQTRQEFIDPLFKALGWDMENEQGYAEAYKDVVHEDAIKIGRATKAPDYSFRIGGVRKFFVEAKKPSVDIKADIHPAYQLRRYAWSAKLALSILTDFEEFAVYDCRVKPEKTDKASKARTLYLTYRDYGQHWDKLAAIFSREAILKGSFDQYAESHKEKRGTAEVDAAFLQEIERWRELLARNIALRNPRLTRRELNFAVQRTIDRIIFLRICEDRGIEEYGRLMALQTGTQVYPRLLKLFYQADDRYNSGIFHFKSEKARVEAPDALTPELTIDDAALKDMLKNLYYPDSPYEFSVVPADILGQVYEQFLGKVIRLTAGHQARVEEKPEVKKAGGVYYTPTYIVEYIVKHTVGALLREQSPKQAEKLAILDPACGSGSFLLGAYQYLLDWHRDAYLSENPEKWSKGRQPRLHQNERGEWKLTIEERKRILLNHIYGVDIDAQAVEVTKLSLLLKVLEGEDEQTLNSQMALFQQRVLPDLSDNIKCGNSLIGSDFYEGQQLLLLDEEEMYRVNAFDWDKEFPEIMQKGGFDAVIGNPPWGASFDDQERVYLVKHYPLVPTKTKDSYLYFFVRTIQLLKPYGLFGFIIPNTWLLINNAIELRREILLMDICEIIDHGDGVFKKATVESSTLILKNSQSGNNICSCKRIKGGEILVDHIIDKSIWLEDEYVRIILDRDSACHELLKKLYSQSMLFEKNCSIIWGIKPYQVGHGEPPQTEEMMKKRIYHSTIKNDDSWKPLLVGADINRYSLHFPGDRFIKYGKHLMYPSNETLMLQPKILMRQTSADLKACYDDSKYYCQNSLFIIHANGINLKYVLGLLNSKLLNFVYKSYNPQVGKVFAEIKPSVIKQLPIRVINFSDDDDKAQHDQIVALVERMLDLHKQLHTAALPQARTLLQRQLDAADRQLDRLVYEVYGLTEEEIQIVEEQQA